MNTIDLSKFVNLSHIIDLLDRHLISSYPRTFSHDRQVHPYLPLKKNKIIHDNLWGTNRFNWLELSIMDTPIFQRLRYIHQTGLASHVYMSAHHTRFEHSLGVCTVSSRIIDEIYERERTKFCEIIKKVFNCNDENVHGLFLMLRQELRLAALLHDIGHSLFSHTSERVYGSLKNIALAIDDLSELSGKEKGAGEVISFCLVLAPSMQRYLDRVYKKIALSGDEEYFKKINFDRVALMIIGRSHHPYLQFMGDIISSGFDADKLDYLLRDAKSAGLPLRYDFERYLYAVCISEDQLGDGEGKLKNLYRITGSDPERKDGEIYPYYDSYRLRLPKKAMNAVEQIVISKMMLFSYIYHHRKVRAAEGLLERVLRAAVDCYRDRGMNDDDILLKFMSFTDSSLPHEIALLISKTEVSEYPERISHRYLPRELVFFNRNTLTFQDRAKLKGFLEELLEREKQLKVIAKFETVLGELLLEYDSSLGSDAKDALKKTGTWLDVPKVPKFEDIHELVVDGPDSASGSCISKVFPIGEWTEAYMHYRYHVRLFCFSEYTEIVGKAANETIKKVVDIHDLDALKSLRRSRPGCN